MAWCRFARRLCLKWYWPWWLLWQGPYKWDFRIILSRHLLTLSGMLHISRIVTLFKTRHWQSHGISFLNTLRPEIWFWRHFEVDFLQWISLDFDWKFAEIIYVFKGSSRHKVTIIWTNYFFSLLKLMWDNRLRWIRYYWTMSSVNFGCTIIVVASRKCCLRRKRQQRDYKLVLTMSMLLLPNIMAMVMMAWPFVRVIHWSPLDSVVA